MGESAAAVRARAIEGFASALSELREAAGTPSFRTMSGRSHAISHTTLHEAVKGNRLPSWATTVEFVKACGGDPAEFRERWERASADVGCVQAPTGGGRAVAARLPVQASVSAVLPRGSALVLDDERLDGPPGPAREAETEQGAGTPPARPRWALVAGAVVSVVALAATGVVWSVSHDAHAASPAPSGPSAADCPVRQQNPPPAEPEHTGDRAAYVADLTLPDCSHVGHDQTVRKVWRFKNAGTVAWRGYSLHRIDLPQQRDQCQTINDVSVPDTPPGELVDIAVEVATPAKAGFCFVRFKMVDAAGRVAFPGSRPVNFQVVVD